MFYIGKCTCCRILERGDVLVEGAEGQDEFHRAYTTSYCFSVLALVFYFYFTNGSYRVAKFNYRAVLCV